MLLFVLLLIGVLLPITGWMAARDAQARKLRRVQAELAERESAARIAQYRAQAEADGRAAQGSQTTPPINTSPTPKDTPAP